MPNSTMQETHAGDVVSNAGGGSSAGVHLHHASQWRPAGLDSLTLLEAYLPASVGGLPAWTA